MTTRKIPPHKACVLTHLHIFWEADIVYEIAPKQFGAGTSKNRIVSVTSNNITQSSSMHHFRRKSASLTCIHHIKVTTKDYVSFQLLSREKLITQIIVRIDKRHPFSFGNLQSTIASRTNASIFLMNNRNPAILPCVFFADLKRFVLAAIVHQDQFEISKRLHQNRIDTLIQRGLSVVNRYNNRILKHGSKTIYLRMENTAGLR